jgi:uncharacterized protein (DUF2249 family)/TusA-related sulfurtransferase
MCVKHLHLDNAGVLISLFNHFIMNSITNKINEQTKISALIKTNPLVIDTLVKFNPHFKKLKNVILRKLLAPRVTIAEACVIGKCNVSDFLNQMKKIGFEIEELRLNSIAEIQQEIVFSKTSKVLDFDVRPILAQEKDPLKLIIQKVDALEENQILRIINDFEPLPLINLLVKKGFNYQTEKIDEHTVITSFVKIVSSEKLELIAQGKENISDDNDFEIKLQSFSNDKLHVIDVRELEMPLPMITILEFLKKMKSDEALFVHHKKVPAFLLPELKEKEFKFLIQHKKNNKINMLIFK